MDRTFIHVVVDRPSKRKGKQETIKVLESIEAGLHTANCGLAALSHDNEHSGNIYRCLQEHPYDGHIREAIIEVMRRAQTLFIGPSEESYAFRQQIQAQARAFETINSGFDDRSKKLDARERDLEAREQILKANNRDLDKERKGLYSRKRDLQAKQNKIDRLEDSLNGRRKDLDDLEEGLRRKERRLNDERNTLKDMAADLNEREEWWKRRSARRSTHGEDRTYVATKLSSREEAELEEAVRRTRLGDQHPDRHNSRLGRRPESTPFRDGVRDTAEYDRPSRSYRQHRPSRSRSSSRASTPTGFRRDGIFNARFDDSTKFQYPSIKKTRLWDPEDTADHSSHYIWKPERNRSSAESPPGKGKLSREREWRDFGQINLSKLPGVETDAFWDAPNAFIDETMPSIPAAQVPEIVAAYNRVLIDRGYRPYSGAWKAFL